MKKILSLSFFVLFLAVAALSLSPSKPDFVKSAIAACTPDFQTCGGSLPRGYQQCNSQGTAYNQYQCQVGYHCGGVPGEPGNVSCYKDTPPPTATATLAPGVSAAPTLPPGTACTSGARQCIGTSGSTTTYQTCNNGNWGANETCPTAGTFCYTLTTSPFASCKAPTVSVAPTSVPGANYTVSGKIFYDNAFSGDRNQAGVPNVGVALTYQTSGSSITKADGTYTITLPYKTGSITEDVVVSVPSGYSISPATLDTQLTTGTKEIRSNTGNLIRITLSPSNPNPVVDFGIVTPPSSVKVSYGTNSINTEIFGTTRIMVDQTIQGGGVGGLIMSHGLTDKNGKVSFTGIKNSDFGYGLTLSVPNGFIIQKTVVNGVDIGGSNPVKFVFQAVNMTGWNQSLMVPMGTGVVYFKADNIVYVDPSKNTTPVNVQWYIVDAGSVASVTSYFVIAYPNGGGYCEPVTIGGQPISACAQLKNHPPGGVTGTDPNPNPSAGVSQVPSVSVAPSGTPNKPVCDVVTNTGPCTGAVANTCSTNNGTQAVVYDSSSTGQPCQQKIVNNQCTQNNCSTGNSCQSGVCKPGTQPSSAPTTGVTGGSGACTDFFTWFNSNYTGASTPQAQYDFLLTRGGTALVTTAANQGLFGIPGSSGVNAYGNITISGSTTNSSGGFTYNAWRNGQLVHTRTYPSATCDVNPLNIYYLGNPAGEGHGPVLNGSIPGTSSTCGGLVNGGSSTPYLTPQQGAVPTLSCPTAPTPTGGAATSFTVEGHVYVDSNSNSTRDSTEPGFNGQDIVTYSASSQGQPFSINASSFNNPTRGGNGYYGVLMYSGQSSIKINLPNGYTNTTPSSKTFSNPTQNETVDFGIKVTGTSASPTQVQFTPTVTATVTPIPSPTISPTPVPGDTVFNIVLGLDGLGSTGDNVAPNNSSGSNKDPLNKTRNVVVELFNNNNNLVLTKTGSVIYNTGSGKFAGTVNMGNGVANGSYTVKIKSDGYLRKLLPGIQVLSATAGVNNVTLPSVNLVTGDITQDNVINIIDYNIFVSCSVFSADSGQLCNSNSFYRLLSDLDDNGEVNQFDYNLFIREYSVQNGQ